MLDRRAFLSVAGASAAALALAGCNGAGQGQKTDSEPTPAEEAKEAEPVDVRAVALKGPTAMGLVRFMSEVDAGNLADNNYQFSIVASPDEVTPKIAKGELDIAAVPANLASVLYNKTEGGVRVICVNTLGVLYICEQGDTVQTVADLAGKTIYASGKGSTPEYALSYILEKNDLVAGTDVTVEWKSEHAECVAALASDPNGIALLPQPFVTTAQAKNDQIRVALDLTKEWDAIQERDGGSSQLITGAALVRSDFADEHPEAVDAFLSHYAESVQFVQDNLDEAAKLVGSYDIVPEAVAKKALPACNIVCITGAEMKESLSGYLSVLADQNAEAVGGKLPGDDFYYGA